MLLWGCYEMTNKCAMNNFNNTIIYNTCYLIICSNFVKFIDEFIMNFPYFIYRKKIIITYNLTDSSMEQIDELPINELPNEQIQNEQIQNEIDIEMSQNELSSN